MILDSRYKALRARIPSLLCFAVLCGILVAGLWPFERPPNEVTWLGNENGLRLGGFATLRSTGFFQTPGPPDDSSCSLDLWLQPGITNESNTILAFSTAANPRQLILHQYHSMLILTREIQSGPRRTATIGIDNAFRQIRPAFITIASGPRESAMYVDGVLARKFPGLQLASDCTGQLVVGTSPVVDDSWSGKLRGIAIYRQELTAAQALRHYETWTTQGSPDLSADERPVALYLFSERSGSIVHNAVPGGIDLQIPKRYSIVHQRFLQPFWEEYKPDREYGKDILINIAGFMPLGFFFCAYWSRVRQIGRAALVTTAFGLAVSLTIEVLQSHLPTRNSGTTDLFTNTLGTFLGASLCDLKVARYWLARIYLEP
jgi:VanZ family protein